MYQVWDFQSAPDWVRKAASQGGDEDWVVLVHSEHVESLLKYGTPLWIEALDSCREPVTVVLENGDILIVGCHA